MKKVILTGASGFIGRHTISHLLRGNYEVHALFYDVVPQQDKQENLIWHKCNVLDLAAQQELCREIAASHLLHFAWYTEPGKYWDSLENEYWVKASTSLIENFISCGGIRAVVAGTCAEYDWKKGYCSEDSTPLAPGTLYGKSKNALHGIIKDYYENDKLSYAWGRIFYLYGPYENPQRLVPSVIRALLKDEPVKCTHGRQVRDFLYVDDVARAFVDLLTSNVIGAVNISSGRGLALRQVVFTAADCFGKRNLVEFGALAAPVNEPPLIVGDNHRLTLEVGWRPAYGLADGIAKTIEYWQGYIHS